MSYMISEAIVFVACWPLPSCSASEDGNTEQFCHTSYLSKNIKVPSRPWQRFWYLSQVWLFWKKSRSSEFNENRRLFCRPSRDVKINEPNQSEFLFLSGKPQKKQFWGAFFGGHYSFRATDRTTFCPAETKRDKGVRKLEEVGKREAKFCQD